MYDRCALGIGQDNAAVGRQYLLQEIRVDGEEKKISILKVLELCLIGAKIGGRGFDLDDRDPALPVESDHIDPAALLQSEFNQATFAALREES